MKIYTLLEGASPEEIKKAAEGKEDSEETKKLKKENEDLKAENKKLKEKKEAKGDGKDTCPTCGEKYDEEDTEGEDCKKCKEKKAEEKKDKKKKEEDAEVKKILADNPTLPQTYAELVKWATKNAPIITKMTAGQRVDRNQARGVGEPTDNEKAFAVVCKEIAHKDGATWEDAGVVVKGWGENPADDPNGLTAIQKRALKKRLLDLRALTKEAPVAPWASLGGGT